MTAIKWFPRQVQKTFRHRFSRKQIKIRVRVVIVDFQKWRFFHNRTTVYTFLYGRFGSRRFSNGRRKWRCWVWTFWRISELRQLSWSRRRRQASHRLCWRLGRKWLERYRTPRVILEVPIDWWRRRTGRTPSPRWGWRIETWSFGSNWLYTSWFTPRLCNWWRWKANWRKIQVLPIWSSSWSW